LKYLTQALAGLTAFALLGACASGESESEVRAPPVATAPVVARDLEDCIDASGELVARLQTTLAAVVSGRVTRILREEGDAIALGEVVIEIDPERRRLEHEAAKARLAKADASLENERREVQRVRTLHDRDIASKAQLDTAETALKLAVAGAAAERAELGVSQRALDDANVAAPFAGLLARRFHVSEIDSGRVRVGQKVELSVAPYPDRIFEASVAVVSPTIDSESRTLRVKAVLPNPDGLLRPGLFAHADLGVSVRRGVALVPEEAVLQRSDGSVLFAMREGNRVERRVVKTGRFHEGSVEILEGVAPGDVVVTRGHTGLVDGSTVRVVAGPASAPQAGLAHRGEPLRGTL
jgi:membrane fusion protein (multidrug efflux system)